MRVLHSGTIVLRACDLRLGTPGCTVRIILPVLLIAFSAACATGNKSVRTGPSYQQRMSRGVRVAAFVDTCVAIDVVGDNVEWSLDESLKAGRLMLRSAARKVAAAGHVPVLDWAPFACWGEVPQWRTSQLQSSNEADSRPGSENTSFGELRFEVTAKVRNWLDSRDTLGATGLQSDRAFIDQINLIADRSGADVMLVLLARGVRIPGGKQAAQAILTAIVSLGMATAWESSYLDSWAALLDLRSGEILWSNSRRLTVDPTSEEFYSTKWPGEIFAQFGAEETVRPSQTTQDK